MKREWPTEVGPVDLMCKRPGRRLGRRRDQAHRHDRGGRAADALPRLHPPRSGEGVVPRHPRRAAAEAAGDRARGVARHPLRRGRPRGSARRARARSDAVRRLRADDRLQIVARRIREQSRQSFERDLVREQRRPRPRAAREERERGAHVLRRVMERTAHGQLVVVNAIRVDGDLCLRPAGRRTSPRSRRCGRATARRAIPPPNRSPRSRRPRRTRRRARRRTAGASARRSARPPTRTGRPPASATHAQSISPIGPAPSTATVSPGSISARSTPRRQHASGSTSAATSGASPGGTGRRFDARDPLRHDDQLRVRAVQQRQQVRALRFLAAPAGRALAARRRVRRDDASPGRDVDPAELVPERRRQLRQQQRMPATERLQVGAVRQRDLDLDEHVAGSRHRVGHLLDAQVADAVVAQRPHGTNTTFAASRARNSSSPSANRSSGSTVGSGRSSSGSSAAAARIASGDAERRPATVSSLR